MKTVLLTGASGYLGQHFQRFYRKLGWRVVTLGRRAEDDIFWDAQIRRRIDASDFNFAVNRIVHCAAVNETRISESIETTFDVNVTFTRTMANLAINLEVEDFIYISTFHVYGVSCGTVGPNTECNPLNDYGLTHYLSEEILRNTLPRANIRTLCLRPTNLYGHPSSMADFDRWSLIPFAFVRQAMEEGCIRLLSVGTQERNFVDVRSVVEAAPQNTGFEVRDVYGSETLSIIGFAELVATVINKRHHKNVQVVRLSQGLSGRSETAPLCFLEPQGEAIVQENLEEFIEKFSENFC